MIWTNQEIQDYIDEGELDISEKMKVLMTRFVFDIKAGVSTYVLPEYTDDISRVTWMGKKLDPYSIEYVIGSESTPITVVQGMPKNYVYTGFGIKTIKLYPAPGQDLPSAGINPFRGTDIMNSCIAELYRHPDPNDVFFQLPEYVRRRIIKCFVLWKCFAKEGVGQDLNGAMYYQKKYEMQIAMFKDVQSNIYSIRPSFLSDGRLPEVRLPRPVLPSKFYEI